MARAMSWLTEWRTCAPACSPTSLTMKKARMRESRMRSSIRTFHAMMTSPMAGMERASSGSEPGVSMMTSWAPTPSV